MLPCLSHCQTEKMTRNLERKWFRGKEGGAINYSLLKKKKLWMKELLGPKVLRIVPTVVSLTMSTAEKPISYCSLRGYLALTSCLPMKKRSMERKKKTAWRQGCDVTPPLMHWTLTVCISRPICMRTKPETEPRRYTRGCINNNKGHAIKGNHGVSLSF